MRARAYPADDEPTFTNAEPGGQLFTGEEMQAIRDQYEETLENERSRREELEWQVRMLMATVRDAELDARRSADQMQKVHMTLQALMVGRDAVEAKPQAPTPAPRPSTAPRPTAKIGGPPPIPPKAQNTRRGPLPPRDLTPFKRFVA